MFALSSRRAFGFSLPAATAPLREVLSGLGIHLRSTRDTIGAFFDAAAAAHERSARRLGDAGGTAALFRRAPDILWRDGPGILA